MKCIDQDVLIKKMINIAVNCVWDADAIGYFQHNLNQYASTNDKSFVKILNTFSPKDITSVWAFYFDYEDDTARKGSYEHIIKSAPYKNMLPSITAGYKAAVKRNASH